MPTEQEYAIGELADLAGVTPRTIRYYVSIGLLPAPEQAGPRTRYGDGHLKRLRLIRNLQRQHLPLGESAPGSVASTMRPWRRHSMLACQRRRATRRSTTSTS